MNSNNVALLVYEQRRKRMIRKQIQKRGICDQVVLNAMLNVPRHLFMRADMTSRSYHDQAAPIDCQQTISQPYIVALMTELLELDSQSNESKVGNGYYGWEDHAPYDRIIVTAAPLAIPDVLIDQLGVDGRLVIPVGDVDQDLMLITKTVSGVERKVISGVRFVLMTSPLA